MDTRQLMRLIYRLGETSFSGLKQVLQKLGGDHGEAAAYIQRLPPYLAWELQRWKRRQILAQLQGEDPANVPPPPSLRVALIEAIVEHGRVPVSDEEVSIILGELAREGKGAEEK